ncbi:hypothetical protein ACGFYQ_34290 [Streptomyces sp. NPDC048258]|uniref:hypothetical protein n=1 Tax=Streptomyces sp. NPDC048258 TaxID=3365527 RepID=UPI0037220D7E
MTTLESVTVGAEVGAILPLLIAVVQRPHWSVKAKKTVASVSALLVGLVTVATAGGWEQFQHGKLTLATIIAVLAASQTSYDLLWKPSTLAPVIEAVTTPKRPQRAE